MFLEDYNCVFCATSPTEESVTHLFLDCPFAQTCWASLGLLVPQSVDQFDTIVMFRTQLHCPFALEILITMCWSIWSIWNDLIFRGIQPSLQRCKAVFKREFAQVTLRAKVAYQQ
jgi:hypothetical protein